MNEVLVVTVFGRLTVADTVHCPSAVAGYGTTLAVKGVMPVVLLAGSVVVAVLSVQLNAATLTVTSSLAVAPLEVVPVSTTDTAIADGDDIVPDTLQV